VIGNPSILVAGESNNEFLKEHRKVETTAQRFRGSSRATAEAN
jgi:hypothetical protein